MMRIKIRIHIPLTPGNRFGMVYVRYAVKQEKEDDREHLLFYERNVALPDKKISAGNNPDEGDFSELTFRDEKHRV